MVKTENKCIHIVVYISNKRWSSELKLTNSYLHFKFQRASSNEGQYRSYLDYIENIGKTCGFDVKEDVLRIPSTKKVRIPKYLNARKQIKFPGLSSTLRKNMARKQCFLVCSPSGNMAKKQCFLVCPPSGNMARKQCFLVCQPSKNIARKTMFSVSPRVSFSFQNLC
jgi:hypothetical protein